MDAEWISRVERCAASKKQLLNGDYIEIYAGQRRFLRRFLFFFVDFVLAGFFLIRACTVGRLVLGDFGAACIRNSWETTPARTSISNC
jgi:hypothetical protein